MTAIMLTLALVSAPAAGPRLLLDEAGPCSLADAVRARLPGARTQRGGQARGEDLRLRLTQGEGGWTLRVAGADGQVAMERELGKDGGCDAVARSAALIVARLLEDLRWPGLPAEIEAGALAGPAPPPPPPTPAPEPTPPAPAPEPGPEPLEVQLVLSAGGALGFVEQGGGAVIDLRAELPLGLVAAIRGRVQAPQSSPIEFEGRRLGTLPRSVLMVGLAGGWCGLQPVRACGLIVLGGVREAVEVEGVQDQLFGRGAQSQLSPDAGLLAEAEYEPVAPLVLRAGLSLHAIGGAPSWSVDGIDGAVRQASGVEFLAHATVGARLF